MSMDETLKGMVNLAFNMKSNEDEFGIFLQGYSAAMVHTHGLDLNDMVDPSRAPENAGCYLAGLFDAFLISKRHVESESASTPEFVKDLRRKVVADLYQRFVGKPEIQN